MVSGVDGQGLIHDKMTQESLNFKRGTIALELVGLR